MLVDIDEARDHLRIDGNDHDNWLNVWIPAISQAVLLWLKDQSRAYQPVLDSNGGEILDSDGEPELEVKPVVKAAVLVELASQFRFREGEGSAIPPAHWGHGYTLNAGSTALLTPLRKGTVA